jgi:hypothetical protein
MNLHARCIEQLTAAERELGRLHIVSERDSLGNALRCIDTVKRCLHEPQAERPRATFDGMVRKCSVALLRVCIENVNGRSIIDDAFAAKVTGDMQLVIDLINLDAAGPQ